MNLTKEYISELKQESNSAFEKFVNKHKKKPQDLLFILENLGHLPKNFDGNWLTDFFKLEY